MRSLSLLPLLPALALSLQAAVDTNSNNYSDVWESRYDAVGIDPALDPDLDGDSNANEAVAGTDPFDGMSTFRHGEVAILGPDLSIPFASQPGKQYQLQCSPSLQPASWTPLGSPVLATGPETTFTTPIPPESRKFYRVEVSDADSDGDGVSDWEEQLLAGFDSHSGDSFGSGIPNNDLNAAREIMTSTLTGEVAVSVTTQDAYEKESTHALVTVGRSGATTYPLTLWFHKKGSADPTKSSASANDYRLTDGSSPLALLPVFGERAPVPSDLSEDIISPNGILTNFVVIPANSTRTSIHVEPVTDTLLEAPENLNLCFHAIGQEALTRVCDASNDPANTRLFIAYLGPESSAQTTATGVSTVRLQGDNDIGVVNVTFSGLTSPQSAAHVHVANPVSGPIIESLPLGQVVDHSWELQAAQFLTTEQLMLEALFAGQLYVNVHSQNYPAGEIRGDLALTSGSSEFQEPPPPPPVPTLPGLELDRDILRFLQQSTFGPTVADFIAVRNLVAANGGDQIAAYTQFIDFHALVQSPSLLQYNLAANNQEWALFSDPASPYYDPNFQPNHNNRRRGWWLMSRHAVAQFRERVAFALSELLVVSDQDSLVRNRAYGASHYYDMLKAGAIGSYRALLENVSKHPIMGHYLSHVRNQQAILDGQGNVLVSPDENYAREVLQLLSIGLVMLHPDGSLILDGQGLPIPTYDNEDITEMARVFTGWSFSKKNEPSNTSNVVDNFNFNHHNGNEYYEAQWTNPMKMFEDNGLPPSNPLYVRYHDNGAKTIFHNHPSLQLDIPALQTGEQDLADVMDALLAHPNIGPFLARRLILRLTSSNPSAGYVYRVAQAFENSGGNLGETVKAILLDYEARVPDVVYANTGSGKPKEPIMRYLHYLRGFDAKSELPLADLSAYGYPASELALFPTGTTRMRYGLTDNTLGQTPQSAPSVFNWFVPDYTIAGTLASAGLVAPEFQIATENSVFTTTNYHFSITYNSSGQGGNPLPDSVANGYAEDADHIKLDLAVLESLYMGVVDENDDGVFDNLDTGTFNNPQAIRDASQAVVDGCDLIISAGGLNHRYGDTAGMPRERIIHAVECTAQYWNNNNTQQAAAMNRRIKAAMWLVMSAPEGIVHK